MKKKIITSISTASVLTLTAAACAFGGEVKGNLSLAGSTSMEKLCEAMSESIMEVNPNLNVSRFL